MDSPQGRLIGRFQLRRELGRGAQGVVWLAFDPRLEREVALKQMRADAADPKVVARWTQEARAVSRLSHPNIVPLFEAEIENAQPYLVFEMVSGETLESQIRSRGHLGDKAAVALMLGVLDGLAHAHAAGVIHRDLKPSNVIIDGQGRARVMDFGLAAFLQHETRKPELVGTSAYMAPEMIAGGALSPAVDVFAAGLLLYEMLMGQAAVAERDPYRAMFRLSNEDFSLPAKTPGLVDDALRAIVKRALARDPTMRFADAAAFLAALTAWMVPADDTAAKTEAGSGTLDFLLRRMKHKSDFPALSDSVSRIQQLAQSENESVASLSNEILKDVALTNKLLRLVNSSYYASAGGGTISTVSRAVALVGFAGIRNMALSLVLLDHMHDKQNVSVLREEFLRALTAGTLARYLCSSERESEEAFISALFQNLGRMLTQFYFPEEAEQIRRKLTQAVVAQKGSSSATPGFAEEEAAARVVLGVSFQELAQGVGHNWGLPDNLMRAMRRLPAQATVQPTGDAAERLRITATAANEITDVLLSSGEGTLTQRLSGTCSRYSKPLGVQPQELQKSIEQAQVRMRDLARSLAITVRPGSATARMLGQAEGSSAPGSKPDSAGPDSLGAHTLDAQALRQAPAGDARARPADGAEVIESLSAGIQDITNSLVEENVSLQELLRMVLETMYRSMGFERVVFCLRDPRSGALTGRTALGIDCDSVAKRFDVKLGGASDLFSAVCAKGADMLIADARVANIASRLPSWFVQGVNASTFLLLPLMVKGAPVGLIYADKSAAGSIVVSERELSLLRTLRNQAVMALKHAGKS